METVAIELPSQLYTDLQSLANEEQVDLLEMLTHWAALARQRRAWIQGWKELQRLVQQEGGLQTGATKEEIVTQMRKTRQEIFEAEYAHLYR
jgi:hypothetical protein